MTSHPPIDVCIRGTGIVGRTLALLLARERLRVALVGPARAATPGSQPGQPTGADAARHDSAGGHGDVRAYALNAASRTLLRSLRAWPDDPSPQERVDGPALTAVLGMRVHGDGGGAVTFEAHASHPRRTGKSGTGHDEDDALAWIADVPALEAVLADAVRYQPLIESVDAVPQTTPPLTVICEGRASASRIALDVEYDVTPYGQCAIATRVRSAEPHDQIARQWFDDSGRILALLPLDGSDGHAAAVVWSVGEAEVASLMALPPEEFADRLEAASHGALGRLELTHDRASWPLQLAQARRWIGRMPDSSVKKPRSWALAGDAAHTVHPLAGQGLNLGLADASELARVLRERDYWRSVGDPRLLRRYERARKAGLIPMRAATDGLQRLFTHDNETVQRLRNWGMRGFEHSGPLKRWAVRQAMGL